MFSRMLKKMERVILSKEPSKWLKMIDQILTRLVTTIKSDHGPTCLAVGLWGSELLLASLVSQDCLLLKRKVK